MSQFHGAEHQFDNVKSSVATTEEARKRAALAAKWADADGDGKIDPEEARRAERMLMDHQSKMMHLLQLMREKVRQLTGMGGLSDIKKLFKKFDPDHSGSITWEEFDGAMASLGIPMEQAELTYLMRLFDHDGEGTIEYEEFCMWMDSSTKMDQETVAEAIFASFGGAKKKSKGPSKVYMQKWLAANPELVAKAQEAADIAEAKKKAYIAAKAKKMYSSSISTGMNSEFTTSSDQHAVLKKSQDKSAFGAERKVLEASKSREMANLKIVGQLKDKIMEKTGLTDPEEQLEALWLAFDVNNDGTISWKEFCTGMKELGIKQSDRELMQIIQEFDTNGDGGLDYYEFMSKVNPAKFDGTMDDVTEKTYKQTIAFQKRQLAMAAAKKPVLKPFPAAQGLLKGGHDHAKTIKNLT